MGMIDVILTIVVCGLLVQVIALKLDCQHLTSRLKQLERYNDEDNQAL